MKISDKALLEQPVFLEVLRAARALQLEHRIIEIDVVAAASEAEVCARVVEKMLRLFGIQPDAVHLIPVIGLPETIPSLELPPSWFRGRSRVRFAPYKDELEAAAKIAVIFHSKQEAPSRLLQALSETNFELSDCEYVVTNWGAVRRGVIKPALDPALQELITRIGIGAKFADDLAHEVPGSTMFFRNPEQLSLIRKEFASWKRVRGRRRIRVYGCSTGGEVYTLALMLAELEMLDQVQLLASDINAARVSRATSGVIARRDYFRIPAETRKKYTIRRDEDSFFLHPSVVAAVEFNVDDVLNLDDQGERNYDLVLLQNVTVHLNESEETRAMRSVARKVSPGGLLLLGGARIGAAHEALCEDKAFEPVVEGAREVHEGWVIQRRRFDEGQLPVPDWALPPFDDSDDRKWRFVSAFRRVVLPGENSADEPVISLSSAGVQYHVHRRLGRRQSVRRDSRWEGDRFWALRDISFSAYHGEVIGVIGKNGSGKSTLGRLLAGAFESDEGEVQVRGRVTLLALGLGFKSELSGRENVMINGVLLGMTRAQVREKLEHIVSFSELGEFIDEPVKNYSSGMRARLGFAVAAHFKPEILILDEVLATGDVEFKEKARKKIRELIRDASVVIVISHQIAFVKAICTWAIWLRDGRLVAEGAPDEIAQRYQANLQNPIEED